ncbi:YgjV family protein [Haemophilus influenzae]|uniref:YgjV family protein n=1 Tax=Haemophilus influenzae TaxID=727 RepID=UPI000E343186|nr:YgjV family protein [Haemophilus influenzae]MCK9656696.1 YgjV family protein [Haemophilus influenzae]
MDFNFIEFLGYMATFFVAVSFLFKSIVYLRIVNSIGAILFVIYSVIITAYPVALLNAFLVVVNIYQLWRLKQENLPK